MRSPTAASCRSAGGRYDTREQAIDLRLALHAALYPFGDFGRVLALLREAEALAQAHCHRDLGTLYAKIGRYAEAHTELAAAIEMSRAMEMTFWLPQVEATLAQVEGR